MGQCAYGLSMIPILWCRGTVFLYVMPLSQQSALDVHHGSLTLDAIWLCLMEERLESMSERRGIDFYPCVTMQ
jgi:hypothetical protein